MLYTKVLVSLLVLCFFSVCAATPDAKNAAHQIYRDIENKLKRGEQAARAQFAYLYLQQTDKTTVYYSDPTVQRILGGGITTRLANVVGAAAAWPTTASTLKIAGPTAAGSNAGAEDKLLSSANFNAQYNGVFPAPVGGGAQPCPAYIIYATRVFPCYTDDSNSCGKKFIDATLPKLNACRPVGGSAEARAAFLYLYIGTNAANDWNIQKKNFEEEEIPIIYSAGRHL